MMVLMGLLLPAFLGFSHAELEALERSIDKLRADRAGMRNFSDNERRAATDRRIALLERARDRSALVIQMRVDACFQQAAALNARQVPSVSPAGAPVAAAPCMNVGDGVVPTVVRLEEIEERLSTERWTMADLPAREALQSERDSIKARLGMM